MPSLKMQQWEAEFLGFTGELKELVHKTVTVEKYGIDTDEIKQQFLIKINKMFDCGHVKVRKMNKTVAFLHRQLDEATGSGQATGQFKMGDVAHGKGES